VEFPARYTLVLNSYQRHELLQRAIGHYAQCAQVDAIRVVRLQPVCQPPICLTER
jgi:hypothetical protein